MYNISEVGISSTSAWGNLALAVVGVVAVTALCALTAGAGAAVIGGVTAAKVAAATTAAVGLVAGGVEIADQIIEEKDVVDPAEAVSQSWDAASSEAIDALAGGFDEAAETVVFMASAYKEIYNNAKSDVLNGATWEDAMIRNAQEYLITSGVEEGIDYVLFPHATDILTNTAKLLFPESD